MSSPAGTGNAVSGSVRTAGSSISMTCSPDPSSRDRTSAVVTTAIGAESASTNSMRALGTLGSTGTYAAPVLSTAKIATTASGVRGSNTPTRAPGPARKGANRLADSSTSRYVTERPSNVSATAPGQRATWAANNAGIDTG